MIWAAGQISDKVIEGVKPGSAGLQGVRCRWAIASWDRDSVNTHRGITAAIVAGAATVFVLLFLDKGQQATVNLVGRGTTRRRPHDLTQWVGC